MSLSKLGRRWILPAICAGIAGANLPSIAQEPATAKATPGQKAAIYDEKADAKQLIAKAVMKANRDNSRVLVMFGGNWCGWCHKLHGTLKSDAKLAKTMLDEYQLVMVDTAAPNAKEVMADYKVDPRAGVPYLVVLDGNGKVLCNQETSSLEEGDHHDPAKVLAFLEKNRAEPADAKKAYEAALSQAASQDKLVFLHFGAPWCGWCHHLENFLARDDMAAIFDRQFVDRKIDVDRMTGGKEMAEKFKADRKGIPWFAFLDRDGKVVADSDGPDGQNIGYPAEPKEIDHFIAMLKKAATKLTPEQIAKIEAELKSAGDKIRNRN
ncbi:MAG: thioredoxin family protein [Isosphaeraceae bacterium]